MKWLPTLLKSADILSAHPASLVGMGLSILCRAKNIEKTSRRTAILRPGGMGDLVCLVMAVEHLGMDARSFFWVIEKRSAGWARYLGLEHICYDEAGIFGPLRWASSFDQVINTEQLFGLSQSFALSMRRRGGKLFCFSTNRCSQYADVRVEYDWKDAHEVTEFARLLSAALSCNLPSGSQNPSRARNRPSGGRKMVCLAGFQSESRRISVERWAGLIEQWAGSSTDLLLAHAPEDRRVADKLCELLGNRIQRFSGSFESLCDEVASAESLFTMDGGMVHIASYFGIPTTVLFTSGRDHKWAPLALESAIVRTQGLSCQPCTQFGQTPPCSNHFKCHELDVQRDSISLPCQTPSGQ